VDARRYFRYDWESEGLGPGSIWTEFVGEEPTRQVECYANRWFSSRNEHHPELGPGLAEGPLSAMNYPRENEVTAEEFEEAWRTAGQHES
jgi:hypothetical protein